MELLDDNGMLPCYNQDPTEIDMSYCPICGEVLTVDNYCDSDICKNCKIWKIEK